MRQREQDGLVRAIESAIDVSRPEQFEAWMRGPFRAVLPHESVSCIEFDEQGGVRQFVCLHHKLIDAVTMELLHHPDHGLAVRLARSYRNNRRQSCTLDPGALRALQPSDGKLFEVGLLRNAVVHRIKLLSGPAYRVVLINVAEEQLERSRHLLRLLSSHVTMALARALAQSEHQDAARLTQRELEILRWMGEGKSNREISIVLGISAITLKSHIAKLYRKLDVQNRAEAVSRGLAAEATADRHPRQGADEGSA